MSSPRGHKAAAATATGATGGVASGTGSSGTPANAKGGGGGGAMPAAQHKQQRQQKHGGGSKRRPLSHYVSRRPMGPIKQHADVPVGAAARAARPAVAMDYSQSCSGYNSKQRPAASASASAQGDRDRRAKDSADVATDADVPSLRKLYERHANEHVPLSPSGAALWLSETGRPPLFVDDTDYNMLAGRVQDALEHGIEPRLITAGSSGSYFVYTPQPGAQPHSSAKAAGNGNGESQPQPQPQPQPEPDAEQLSIVAVFKPKDEEPFAPLNPKWPKSLQRMMSPCCFGRHCLLSNHGYLSEVCASLVDEWLQLDIVPKTRLVWLASSTFNYPTHVRNKVEHKGKRWPPKVGSMQTFVTDYQSAGYWLKRFANNEPQLSEAEHEHFVTLFHKMVLLDYIIRNTDRSHSNWLIFYDENAAKQSSSAGSPMSWLRIAAIDNGLAFPIKHPFEVSYWRPFPFYWAALQPYADVAFSQPLADSLLPLISDAPFIEDMCAAMQTVFKQDDDFNMMHFRGQMSVVKGQLCNVRLALAQRMSPAELAKLPPLIGSETALGKRVRRDRVAVAKLEARAVATALATLGTVCAMPGAPPAAIALAQAQTNASGAGTSAHSLTAHGASDDDRVPQTHGNGTSTFDHKAAQSMPLSELLAMKLRTANGVTTDKDKGAYEQCYRTREATPAGACAIRGQRAHNHNHSGKGEKGCCAKCYIM